MNHAPLLYRWPLCYWKACFLLAGFVVCAPVPSPVQAATLTEEELLQNYTHAAETFHEKYGRPKGEEPPALEDAAHESGHTEPAYTEEYKEYTEHLPSSARPEGEEDMYPYNSDNNGRMLTPKADGLLDGRLPDGTRFELAIDKEPPLQEGREVPIPGKDVVILPQSTLDFYKQHDANPQTLAPLHDVRVAVNAEGRTIKDIVNTIVRRAEEKTGPWHVKWRLRPENTYLLDERVNLTAESTFGQFMDYLSDRLNNITGVKLGVTVFEASRILVISDTL